jgi:hypothetical protein
VTARTVAAKKVYRKDRRLMGLLGRLLLKDRLLEKAFEISKPEVQAQ